MAIALCVSDLTQLYGLLRVTVNDRSKFSIAAISTGAIVSFVLCISCLLFPRRPTVEHNGHPVDRQYSVPALMLWTIAWSLDVLSLARNKQNLDVNDLPLLHRKARSGFLLGWLDFETGNHPLWKLLLYKHSAEFIFQSSFAMVQAVLQFAPQYVMYRLLRLLELSPAGPNPTGMFLF